MGKRRKDFYSNNFSNKRFKYVSYGKLDVGCKGIVITHDRGKENHCRNDALRLFNHFADKWYGEFISKEIEHSSAAVNSFSNKNKIDSKLEDFSGKSVEEKVPDEDSDEDINAGIEKEVRCLKDSSSFKHTQRFSSLKSGCNNIVFIKCVGINPSDFIQRVVESIEAEKKSLPIARGVLRIHPADVSCKARILEIKEAAECYLPKALEDLQKFLDPKLENKVRTEFNILYRGRNNEHLHMHDVKDAISSAADDACPTWHYNCRCETIYVVVDVLKMVCTMGVLHNYAKYKKFNVRELFLLNQEENSSDNIVESRVKISVEEKSEQTKENESDAKPSFTETKSEP